MRAAGQIWKFFSLSHWRSLEHVDFDGLGAVSLLLRGPGAPPPQSAHLGQSRPGIFKTLIAIFKHARSRKKPLTWKNYQPERVGPSPAIAWVVFSAAQTLALKDFARSKKISLTSVLLFSIDQTTRDCLIVGTETRWVIPVNMRGLIAPSTHPNQIAFLNVSFQSDHSPKDFYDRIKQKFAEGNHWAHWALMHIGKYVGLNCVERIYREQYSNPKPDTGTFSNLGDWHSDRIKPDEDFITAAPCSKLTPLTLAVICVNGKLSVTFQIHPSLEVGVGAFPEFVGLWQKQLENVSGISISNAIGTAVNKSDKSPEAA